MIGNIPRVNNPLTVIAIFAGLSEIAMTTSLGLLQGEAQFWFMWFAGGFPTFIAIGFFLVLIFRPALLYAPSDWRDEKYAFDLIREKNALRGQQIEEVYEKFNDLVETKFSLLESNSVSTQEHEEAKSEIKDLRERLKNVMRSYKDEASRLNYRVFKASCTPELGDRAGSTKFLIIIALGMLGSSSEEQLIEWVQHYDACYPVSVLQDCLYDLVDRGTVVSSDAEHGGTRYSLAIESNISAKTCCPS